MLYSGGKFSNTGTCTNGAKRVYNLAKEISKQIVESADSFFSAVYGEVQRKREKLTKKRTVLLSLAESRENISK